MITGPAGDARQLPPMRPTGAMAMLSIEGLTIAFVRRNGNVSVLRNVDLAIGPGQAVGLVGESGSGKSMTALAVMRLLPRGARILSGKVLLEGQDLVELPESEMSSVRGRIVSMISQDPQTALNPAFTIERQLTDALRAHRALVRRAARERAAELLALVGIPSPRSRLSAYPHEFSGGMRQRVAIAMAVACEPKLLIADEPTTALDVTIQAQVIALIERLRRDMNLSVLFISHNLDLVAEICDRVTVMYAGSVVEADTAEAIFRAPRHPYTRELLRCIPRLAGDAGPLPTIPGSPPRFGADLAGCPFAPRCTLAETRCRSEAPRLRTENERRLSCWVAP
jgi:oligopeptide/dipeptide ABC transporter ATP-binding protein